MKDNIKWNKYWSVQCFWRIKNEYWWSWFWYDLGSYLQFSEHGGFCYQILAYALLSWFVSGIWFEATGCTLHLYMKLLDIAICIYLWVINFHFKFNYIFISISNLYLKEAEDLISIFIYFKLREPMWTAAKASETRVRDCFEGFGGEGSEVCFFYL